MHEPPLSPSQNGLNLRNPAMQTDDTDPTPSSGPNSTDPIFPPKLGKAGPKDVRVTAVQGPGVTPGAAPETTTTEQLLSGLLEVPDPDTKTKPRKKETSGEREADYAVSPRPVPVGRKVKDAEGIIVAAGGAGHPGSAPTMDLPAGGAAKASKGTRDDITVPLPRPRDRRGLLAFVAAVLLVGGLGWLLLGRATPPEPTTRTQPTTAAPNTPVPTVAVTALPADPNAPAPTAAPTGAPTDTNTVTADPVIESQRLARPRGVPLARPTAATAASAPTAAAPPTAGPAPTSTLAVDNDELKKAIKH